MNHKSVLTYSLLILFVIMAPFVFYFSIKHRSTFISCTSDVKVKYFDDEFDMKINIKMRSGRGSIYIDGNTLHTQGGEIKIDRKVNFTYRVENDRYIMISTEVIPRFTSTQTLEYLKHFLPDFLSFPNRGISYAIYKQQGGAYLLTLGNTPIYYCY